MNTNEVQLYTATLLNLKNVMSDRSQIKIMQTVLLHSYEVQKRQNQIIVFRIPYFGNKTMKNRKINAYPREGVSR